MSVDHESSPIIIKASVSSNGTTNFASGEMIDKTFTIMPATMMVAGAYYPYVEDVSEKTGLRFTSSELERSARSWDGRPVSLGHPDSQESCNCPSNYQKQWIGMVFNSKYDPISKKLKSELWLDNERGRNVIDRVKAGDKIDISIGAYGDLIGTSGKVGDRLYAFEMKNIVGDHLAVLPDGIGACNWEDGCGIRASVYAQSDITKEQALPEVVSSVQQAKQPKKRRGVEAMNDTVASTIETEKDLECDPSVKNTFAQNAPFNMSSWLKQAPEAVSKLFVSSMEVNEESKKKYISNIVSCEKVSFCKDGLSSVHDMRLLKDISTLVDCIAVVASESDNTDAAPKTNYQFKNAGSSEVLDYAPVKKMVWQKRKEV